MKKYAVSVLLFSVLTQSAHAGTAFSSAITTWSSECPGGERTWWDDMCMAWRKEMGNKGWAQKKANYGNVTVERYADPSIQPWGADNGSYGFDGSDAAMLCTHGGLDDVGWYGLMHHKSNGECRLNVNQMSLGKASGGKSKFVHLSSCNSMDWDKRASWHPVAKGGVHIITGFHGLMWIGWNQVGEYEDLADEAYSSRSVANAWVDDMYDWGFSDDTCPVAMAVGETKAKALNRLNYETYKNPTGEQPANKRVYMWIGGCNPAAQNALPE